MEEDFVNSKLENLRLTEEEEIAKAVEVDEDELDEIDKELQFTMACKILSRKTIIGEIFKTIMPRIWNLEEKVEIEKIGKNLFICNFRNKRERDRIVDGGPWSFDKGLLLFEDIKSRTNMEEVDFRYASFWIHFHGLPMAYYTQKKAIALGNSVGIFEKVEAGENGKCRGKTLRVKIKIDVNKPLRRRTKVKTGAMAEETWIRITYEKLPDFCYNCGKVGHVVNDCENQQNIIDLQYGIWLREPMPNKGAENSKNEGGRQNTNRGRGRGRIRGKYWLNKGEEDDEEIGAGEGKFQLAGEDEQRDDRREEAAAKMSTTAGKKWAFCPRKGQMELTLTKEELKCQMEKKKQSHEGVALIMMLKEKVK